MERYCNFNNDNAHNSSYIRCPGNFLREKLPPPDNCPLDYCSRGLLAPAKLLLRIIALSKIDSTQEIVPWMIALGLLPPGQLLPRSLSLGRLPQR